MKYYINTIITKYYLYIRLARAMGSGEAGSGAGKGGGTGGSIRDAGGSFGKREAAQEEQYFRKLVRNLLKLDIKIILNFNV